MFLFLFNKIDNFKLDLEILSDMCQSPKLLNEDWFLKFLLSTIIYIFI